MRSEVNIEAMDQRTGLQMDRPASVCLHVLREARYDTRAIREARALAEAGFNVTILDVISAQAHPTEEKMHGFRMRHILIPDWKSARQSEVRFLLTAVQTFFRSCRQLFLCRADIYHASELTAFPACYIIAKLRRKPLIFEVYDLSFPAPETGVKFWRKFGWVLDIFQRWVLPHCAGIIATSPLHAEELYKRYRVSDITLVRNVPAHRHIPATNRLRQHLGLLPDTRIVLYQGGLQAGRGLEMLISVAPYLQKDIVIVMMGQDMLGMRAKLEALVASKNIEDRVKVIAEVPYEELLEWTASADIGVTLLDPDYSLNVSTSLPNKFFEYLMAGLPVLSSRLPAIIAIIQAYNVGRVVNSFTPQEIGVAINAMLEDRVMLTQMKENALKVAKECCWEKDSLRLIKLYQNILK